MTATAVGWRWDSAPTLITRLGTTERGRVLLTTLDTALFFRHLNENYAGRLEGAQVVPDLDGGGFRVTGTNPTTGLAEEWLVAPLPVGTRPCGCGRR